MGGYFSAGVAHRGNPEENLRDKRQGVGDVTIFDANGGEKKRKTKGCRHAPYQNEREQQNIHAG